MILDEIIMETLCKGTLCNGCIRVHGNDHLLRCRIGICKINIFQTILRNSHTGSTHIIFSGYHCRDDRIKLHILNHQLHTKLITDGLHHIHINTGNLIILIILIWLEGGIRCHLQHTVSFDVFCLIWLCSFY